MSVRTIRRWILRAVIGGVVLGSIGLLAAVMWAQYYYQAPARVVYTRFLASQLWWYEPRYPSLYLGFKVARALTTDDPLNVFEPTPLAEKPLSVSDLSFGPAGPAVGRYPAPKSAPTYVSTGAELADAVAAARPGDVIQLLPGRYDIPKRYLDAKPAGRADAPIIVRAAKLGDATLVFGARDVGFVEGFLLQAPYWIIENLELRGACTDHMACEHGFHVVGGAHHAIIRNNIVRNFNAPLKVNLDLETRAAPDDGLLEHNLFINDTPRNAPNPVNMSDIVAASRWVVRANVFADFAKSQGDMVAYGPYMKGASHGGIIERNLVICSLRHRGGTRIGIGFGGGGSGPAAICADNACAFEHADGVIRNNIIMNCSDVGVYLNNSPNALLINNTIVNTRGVDVRFGKSTASLVNNLIDGRIRARDGGHFEAHDNLMSGWRAGLLHQVSRDIYRNPYRGDFTVRDAARVSGGAPVSDVTADFCGRARAKGDDTIGAVSTGSVCTRDVRLPR